MEDNKSMEVFAKAPIRKAVLQNALPAMAAMLMVLIYNLADTFFIGQTHDDLQVAAVSLATPVFLLFMSVGTVFGIGGTSVISRALGEGRRDYAKKVCSFCINPHLPPLFAGITPPLYMPIPSTVSEPHVKSAVANTQPFSVFTPIRSSLSSPKSEMLSCESAYRKLLLFTAKTSAPCFTTDTPLNVLILSYTQGMTSVPSVAASPHFPSSFT